LKKNSIPRRTKAELIRFRQEKEQEANHIKYLLDSEAMLSEKRTKLEEKANLMKENEINSKYSKDKEIIMETASIKSAQE